MARTSSPYSAPNSEVMLPGRPILAGSGVNPGHVANLALASNWLHAEGHAQPVIHQGWADGQFTEAAAAYVNHCTWPVPALDTDNLRLRCSVYASNSGGNGFVRFTAGGGNTIIGPIGAAGWYDSGSPHLLTAPAGGFDLVTLDVQGDGVNPTIIERMSCTYLALPTPLAGGAVGTFLPTDDAEYVADRPLSADEGRQLKANLTAVESRVHTYMSFSGLAGIAGENYLEEYYHRVYVPVYPETAARGWELTVLAHLVGAAGTAIYLQHGPGDMLNRAEGVGAGRLELVKTIAAPEWLTGTIQLQEAFQINRVPLGPYAGWSQLSMFGHVNTADLDSIAVWGR